MKNLTVEQYAGIMVITIVGGYSLYAICAVRKDARQVLAYALREYNANLDKVVSEAIKVDGTDND